MTHQVTFIPSAARRLRRFDPPLRRRIEAVVELLAEEPRPPAATQLVGGVGEWWVRTGSHRIVYEIIDDRLVVPVLRVGRRTESYRRDRAL